MSDIQPKAILSNLTDEEFMREAYIRGFGSLDSAWVAEMFKRLQRSTDEKEALEKKLNNRNH